MALDLNQITPPSIVCVLSTPSTCLLDNIASYRSTEIGLVCILHYMTRLRVHTITVRTLSGLSVDFSGHRTQRFPFLHKPPHTFKHDTGYLSFCRFKQFPAIAPGPRCRTLFFLVLHDPLCTGVSSPDTLSRRSSLACIHVTDGNANCVPQLHPPLM